LLVASNTALDPTLTSLDVIKVKHRSSLADHAGKLSTATTPAQAQSRTPSGRANRRPHEVFFSIAIVPPKATIQPTLPVPMAIKSIISAQHQPTQK
jgi:hypothetical protein